MMRRFLGAAALLLGSAAPVAAAVAPDAAVAPATDWSKRVEKTAEGGYRLGNPDAPVKLVEFLSLTCGHCSAFAEEARPHLREQIRAGRLSVEYRNYVLNHYDIAAAVLSRCAPPSRYFALTDAFLAQQDSWMAGIEKLTAAQRAEIEVERPTPATVRRTAQLLGLAKITAQHGVPAAKARACLGNAKNVEQLMAMNSSAEQLGIDSTPSFVLNGQVLGPQNWAMIQPLLEQP